MIFVPMLYLCYLMIVLILVYFLYVSHGRGFIVLRTNLVNYLNYKKFLVNTSIKKHTSLFHPF